MQQNDNLLEQETPTGLYEMALFLEKLWNAYFLSPKQKKEPYQKRYNSIAEQYNRQVNFKAMTIINATTKDTAKSSPMQAPGVLMPTHLVEKRVTAACMPKREGSVIAQILEHHKAGLTNQEIIAKGFNKSTVGRQVCEYKKRIQDESRNR